MSFFVIFTRRTSQESGNHVPASIFYILDTDVFCVNKSLVQFLRAGCREYFVYFMPKTSLFSPLRGLIYLLSAKLRCRRTSRAPLPQLITSQRKEYSTVQCTWGTYFPTFRRINQKDARLCLPFLKTTTILKITKWPKML